MDQRVTNFPVGEAKARFSELLGRAERGEEITVRRHGKAVARIVPPKAEMTIAERQAAHDKYLKWRAEHGPSLGPGLTIKQLINEGRK